MLDASPAPNADAPVVDDAAQAAADEAELPPLDHDAEIKDQIARAKLNVERDERKAARAEKKLVKVKGKGAPSKAPAPKPEAKAEPAAEVEAEEAPTKAASLAEARALLEAGDLDGAIKLAFGKDAAALRLNSAKWAEWRKTTSAANKALAEREERLTNGVRQVEAKFGNYVEAAKLYESGDVTGALLKAFKVDPETFQKRLLAQFHGKHPDVERLERKLQEKEAAEEQQRRAYAEHQAKAQEAAKHAKNLEIIGTELADHQDEQIAFLSQKPGFRGRVLQILQQHYDQDSKTTIPIEQAAEMVKEEIERELGPAFARNRSASESPTRTGKTSARPATATLSQRGAAEASPPGGRALSDEDLYRKYTNQFRAANG